jgi:glyoxylase-like metal-dependent hydrolase (beta-lactamase superfamily II)
MLEFESRVQQVEEGYEIEPGVRIMHTPGHSAGTVAVIVDTDNGPVAVTGDGIQSAQVALTKQNALVFWSEKDARQSIERILAATDMVHPGHDNPFRLLSDGRFEYVVPKQLAITGLDVTDPGVVIDRQPRPPEVMPGIETQTLVRLGL